MRIIDPRTGREFCQKRRERFDEAGHARELTFTCFRRYRFLERDRARSWFLEALQAARMEHAIELWAYVIMPEHVHLLVYPRNAEASVSEFLQEVKEPVGRKAVQYLKANAPDWLERVTVREGKRIRHRFWQPGGGYDRNVTDPKTLAHMIEYIHANPVRRGLVQNPTDWNWSSARWFAGLQPVPVEMDRSVFTYLGGTP